MANKAHVVLKANDRSYFAILKKEIHQLAVHAGFSERRVGEIDIIVSEMVSNLVKHAGGGEVWAGIVHVNGADLLELISVDNGPGMADVSKMMVDGMSTKNTLGHGLGAMKRLSDVFQIYSVKEWGTVILARVRKESEQLYIKPPKIEIRSVVLPKPGETVSGDGFCQKQNSTHVKVFLGDGLGHGPEAAKAVENAKVAFIECPDNDPAEIIRYMNLAVKKTRGLVGTVAVFEIKEQRWRICGVGNILTRLIGNGSYKSYMPYNGIIGLNVPRSLNVQEIVHENGQILLMASDGLRSRLDTIKYTGIWRYDLSVLSACLIKDFARFTDDSSVCACKINC